MAHPSGHSRVMERAPELVLGSLAAGLLFPAALGVAVLSVGLLTYVTGGLLGGPAGLLLLGGCGGAAAGAPLAWLQGRLAPVRWELPSLRWVAAGSAGLAVTLGAASVLTSLLGRTDTGTPLVLPLSGWEGMATALAAGLVMAAAQRVAVRDRLSGSRWWPAVSAAGAGAAFAAGRAVGTGIGTADGVVAGGAGLAAAGSVYVAATGVGLLWSGGRNRRRRNGARAPLLDQGEKTVGG